MPQEIVNSVSDTEKKRQEAINEVIYTERDFVRDMEYLRDVPLHYIIQRKGLSRSHRCGSSVYKSKMLFPKKEEQPFSSKSSGMYLIL